MIIFGIIIPFMYNIALTHARVFSQMDVSRRINAIESLGLLKSWEYSY
jgi:hypothetical protein